MLAVPSAFPLTSQQPPVAVVSATDLDALSSGRERLNAQRVGADRLQVGQGDRLEATEFALPKGAIRNPFAVAGPPPSFEANILEIERQFDAILARLELERSQKEMRQVHGSDRAISAHDDGLLGAQSLQPGMAALPQQTPRITASSQDKATSDPKRAAEAEGADQTMLSANDLPEDIRFDV